MTGTLFVISAPSGAGKTSLLKEVLPLVNQSVSVEQVITYTSRSPRPGERNGIDYHFISSDEFEKRIQEGFFLEWSGEYGHYYGSALSIIDQLAAGTSYCMILDRKGAKAVKGKMPQAVLIWIWVSDIEVLRHRLLVRGSENEKQVEKRIALANLEMQDELKEPFYDLYINNMIFQDAVNQLYAIFLRQFNDIFRRDKKSQLFEQNQG